MTRWQNGFIAVDWGTTNRRAYAIGPDLAVGATVEDDRGVLSVTPGGFEDALADIREQLGDRPMLLAGMVGSNRGWAEVPYIVAPANLGDLVKGLHWIDKDIAIVPGLSLRQGTRCDVMRGEEVQALGAVTGGLAAADATICHPGTHTKWITVAGGRITDFRTSMTGELFALLKGSGILSPQLQAPVKAEAAFRDGVDTALAGEPLIDALFAVRSRMLLGALEHEDAASYASGILIGSDVVSHRAFSEPVALVGNPGLCVLYAFALERAGRSSTSVDGAAAFVAGMIAIREMLA